ncbi:hypothetical protein P3W45_000210 [Vairimorpha bombi]|jgi:LPS O-antigen subunit length determinant protein (WzzB/FepE family)
MDNEFLNGIILSYNKIFKEIKIIKEELKELKGKIKLTDNKKLPYKREVIDEYVKANNLNFRRIRKSSKVNQKKSVEKPSKEKPSKVNNITLTNCDFFKNLGNEEY